MSTKMTTPRTSKASPYAHSSEKTPIMSAKRSKRYTPGKMKSGATPPRGGGRPSSGGGRQFSPMHPCKAVPGDSHAASAPAAKSIEQLDTESTEDSFESAARADADDCAILPDVNNDGDRPGHERGSSWVGRKVDAIFSPVLNFLNTAAAEGEEDRARDERQLRDFLDGASSPNGAGPAANDDDYNDGGGRRSHESSGDEAVAEDMARGPSGPEDMVQSPACPRPGGTVTGGGGSSGPADRQPFPAPASPEEDDRDDAAPAAGSEDQLDITPAEEITQDESVDRDEDAVVQEEGDEEEEEFNPYLFIKCLPPYQHVVGCLPGWSARTVLPPKTPTDPPVTLVLDLDETLVHCTVDPVDDPDMVFGVEFNGIDYQVHVRYRPFLREFLEAVSERFEVVVFTASQQVYADKLLDRIDPEGKYIKHRMFRDSCLPVEGNFLKDLTVLGRDLSRTVLVDNSPHAFGYQVDNGVPIESWFDCPHDKELLKLECFLRKLHGCDDVRDVVRRTFQTHRLIAEA